MKIEIEFIDSSSEAAKGWKLSCGDRYADGLTYAELLGLVSVIAMSKKEDYLVWLKTAEEHQQWIDRLTRIMEETSKKSS